MKLCGRIRRRILSVSEAGHLVNWSCWGKWRVHTSDSGVKYSRCRDNGTRYAVVLDEKRGAILETAPPLTSCSKNKNEQLPNPNKESKTTKKSRNSTVVLAAPLKILILEAFVDWTEHDQSIIVSIMITSKSHVVIKFINRSSVGSPENLRVGCVWRTLAHSSRINKPQRLVTFPLAFLSPQCPHQWWIRYRTVSCILVKGPILFSSYEELDPRQETCAWSHSTEQLNLPRTKIPNTIPLI